MGGFSFWHILILAVVVLLLFGGGRGKISDFMGDFAKGIKNFKKGLSDEEPPQPPKTLPRDEDYARTGRADEPQAGSAMPPKDDKGTR